MGDEPVKWDPAAVYERDCPRVGIGIDPRTNDLQLLVENVFQIEAVVGTWLRNAEQKDRAAANDAHAVPRAGPRNIDSVKAFFLAFWPGV